MWLDHSLVEKCLPSLHRALGFICRLKTEQVWKDTHQIEVQDYLWLHREFQATLI